MIERTILYLSRVNRYFSGDMPPIVCYAIGNKQFSKCVCDCKDICKKTPGNIVNRRFNYVDDFDYGAALASLKLKKKNC